MTLSLKNSDPLIHDALEVSETDIRGVAIASLISTLWAGSLIFLLKTEISNLFEIFLAIIWQTFLYTGIFITAHDAMHGAISPKHPRINYLIGSLALLLYGLFSYDQLLKTHWQHHHHPASESDPDFHDGEHKNPVTWYFYFMQRYWSWWRFGGLILIACIMHSFLNIAPINLMLFWALPSLLSSMQLFYFGTFLPHREPLDGYQNSFHTQSTYYPLLWSFLTCYHFGYHEEHHKYPSIPWWKLPAIAKISMS